MMVTSEVWPYQRIQLWPVSEYDAEDHNYNVIMTPIDSVSAVTCFWGEFWKQISLDHTSL